MPEFLAGITLVVIVFFLGNAQEHYTIQEKCIEYYSEMPHNKVAAHCANLLKFEKPKQKE